MKISYDKFRVKIFGIVAATAFVLTFVLSFISLALKDSSDVVTSDVIASLMPLCGGICSLSFLFFVLGKIYLMRLKRYGYEIPDKAKEYDNDLNNLPKDDKIYYKLTHSKEKRDKWSIRLAFIYLAAFVICIGYDIYFIVEWGFLKDSAGFLLTQMIVFDLVWVALFLYFLVHSDNSKYKDSLDLDDSRKTRISFSMGIVLMLFICMMAVGAKAQCASAADYLLKSYETTDLDTLNSIRAVFFEQYKNYPDAFKEDEYIITDMDVPDEPFWSNAAAALDVKSFKELKSRFHVTDGDAIVAIRAAKDGNVVVEILNPDKHVTKEMMLGN